MKGLTKDEAFLIRMALLFHDGETLAPHWEKDKQSELTDALDKLRGLLWDVYEPVKAGKIPGNL